MTHARKASPRTFKDHVAFASTDLRRAETALVSACVTSEMNADVTAALDRVREALAACARAAPCARGEEQ